MSARSAILALAAAVGMSLVVGGVAWACTDFTKIDSIVPTMDPAAAATATAAVQGSGAAAGSMVELRWNALNGPVIARAQADATGAFRADATIPDVPAGIYTVIATDGTTSVGRAPYEVGSAAASGAVAATPGPLAFSATRSPGLGQPTTTPVSAPTLAALGAALVGLASGAALVLFMRRRAFAAC